MLSGRSPAILQPQTIQRIILIFYLVLKPSRRIRHMWPLHLSQIFSWYYLVFPYRLTRWFLSVIDLSLLGCLWTESLYNSHPVRVIRWKPGSVALLLLLHSDLTIFQPATACWALVTFKQAENPTTGVVIVAEVQDFYRVSNYLLTKKPGHISRQVYVHHNSLSQCVLQLCVFFRTS